MCAPACGFPGAGWLPGTTCGFGGQKQQKDFNKNTLTEACLTQVATFAPSPSPNYREVLKKTSTYKEGLERRGNSRNALGWKAAGHMHAARLL